MLSLIIQFLIIHQFVYIDAASLYYVAPNGNDHFDGSQEKPFLTINKGISVATDKDSIVLFPGTYSGPCYVFFFKTIYLMFVLTVLFSN
jgi:hypothetical protein